MDVQYKSIGKRIKLRRKELNIKQNELAEKLNISNNHLSSVENGREKPSLELLLNICELLNVTTDYLLLGNMPVSYKHLDVYKRQVGTIS